MKIKSLSKHGDKEYYSSMNNKYINPVNNLKLKSKIRKQRVGYTKAQYEQMMNVVERYDFLNASNESILAELIRLFPNVPPTYDVLTTLRKKIKARNQQDYDILKTKNDDFINQVLKKRRNLYFIRNEMLQIYKKQEQSDIVKLKILDKLLEIDMMDLQFIQDFPYIHKYHEDLEREFRELNEDINQKDIELRNLRKEKGQLSSPEFSNNTNNKQEYKMIITNGEINKEVTKIPIEEISSDKEIQRILLSRDQSGFTRHAKR